MSLGCWFRFVSMILATIARRKPMDEVTFVHQVIRFIENGTRRSGLLVPRRGIRGLNSRRESSLPLFLNNRSTLWKLKSTTGTSCRRFKFLQLILEEFLFGKIGVYGLITFLKTKKLNLELEDVRVITLIESLDQIILHLRCKIKERNALSNVRRNRVKQP
uniref:Uncharacterized protein n=1 Tax=Cannabis sativa TaxID=3483 RepID=A0A803PQN2_CANSA